MNGRCGEFYDKSLNITPVRLSASRKFRFSDDFDIQFRLFMGKVVRNQSRDKIGKKIVDATMSSMLYLTDIFEHI